MVEDGERGSLQTVQGGIAADARGGHDEVPEDKTSTASVVRETTKKVFGVSSGQWEEDKVEDVGGMGKSRKVHRGRRTLRKSGNSVGRRTLRPDSQRREPWQRQRHTTMMDS